MSLDDHKHIAICQNHRHPQSLFNIFLYLGSNKLQIAMIYFFHGNKVFDEIPYSLVSILACEQISFVTACSNEIKVVVL